MTETSPEYTTAEQRGNPSPRMMDCGERYVLLRRMEQLLCRGSAWTTSELAAQLGLDPRTVRKYLDILQTAEEFRVALEQVGWEWEVFK